MNPSKIIYIITMGWTLIIFGGITYLLTKKQEFILINGFDKRPEEEKQYLEESGYLTALGKVFKLSFWVFAVTFVLGLLPIPYAFEISISLFIVILLFGLVWVQRFEVPHKRKKMTWIMSSIAVGTVAFIGGISALGYMDNGFIVEDGKFEITGMYGVEWKLSDIDEVEMFDTLPEIISKTDGFATSNLLKGKFILEKPYKKGRLFIQNRDAPILCVTKGKDHIFISRKDPEETLQIYKKLQEK
ncbi:DUF3784 domain-containing protein [Virgibacillus soli]|uniref:DUF3784 domain-containing protein n=1 Tax=Paracerasibacillus soli TaxID=480284 RepID=A0ABU5CMN3_9BACI|nr:DUF3784 domain-containing protein [Virgibacillus soli]MDY0407627.1 DUF3784 domain-containing protein [Virgibacillus soli]